MSPGRLPTFVIAGFPKSGTTALASYLAGHPDIYLPPELGLYFFGMNHHRGLDWYRSRFAPGSSVAQAGETSPGCVISDEALSRMAETVPDARVILLLRHPVDRAYSHYWMQRSKFPSPVGFAEVVHREMADPTGQPPAPHLQYLRMGRYYAHIERLLKRFQEERVLTLLFDDLIREPRSVFTSVCTFLGVDPTLLPDGIGQVVNETRPVRSERVRTAMLRLRIGKVLPRGVALYLDGLNRRKTRYPAVDPELREELIAWYAEDNRRLSEWLGRDLSAWSR